MRESRSRREKADRKGAAFDYVAHLMEIRNTDFEFTCSKRELLTGKVE